MMDMDCRWLVGRFCGGRKGVDRAKVFQGREEKERYNRRLKMIILFNENSFRTSTCQWHNEDQVKVLIDPITPESELQG